MGYSEIGFIRLKVQFREKISKNGLIEDFFFTRGGRKLDVGEM